MYKVVPNVLLKRNNQGVISIVEAKTNPEVWVELKPRSAVFNHHLVMVESQTWQLLIELLAVHACVDAQLPVLYLCVSRQATRST